MAENDIIRLCGKPERCCFSVPQHTTDIFYYTDSICVPEIHTVNGRYNALYVCDEHTLPLLQHAVCFQPEVPLAVLPAGERAKTFLSIEYIIRIALEAQLDRKAVFIGFGGGVVCDITALAASLYMRGVQCVLMPSTVLAMADASIGGKTAVNIDNYKNIAGSFYAASAVIFCFPVLHSLPYAHYRSGFAEVLKTAVLYDAELYRMFRLYNTIDELRSDPGSITMIRRAVQAKASVVSADFTEQGERAFLNLGHTFAHALEALTHFSVLHGDAVAWGISRALEAGKLLGITKAQYAEELTGLLQQYGWETGSLKAFLPFIPQAGSVSECSRMMIQYMKKDKKNRSGGIRLIVQEQLMKNRIVPVAEDVLREVLV